jgi:chitodextrinase
MLQHNVDYGSDLSTDWHTWTMDWDTNGVKYYMDGVLQPHASSQGDTDKNIDSYTDFSGLTQSQFNTVMDQMWQLRMNTQVIKSGDAWHPAPDNTQTFQDAYFLIDYVRVMVKDTTPPPPADTTAPSVPTGLSATAPSQTQVDLTWNTSTDNVAVTGYNIYRNNTKIASSTTNSFTDSSVTASTTYNYTVSATDDAGNESVQSTATSITTPAPVPTTLPTPNNLVVTPGTNSVIMNWEASTDSRVDGYSTRYIRSDSTTKSDGSTWIYPGRTNSTSQTISGLIGGVSYDFQVRAIDDMGTPSTDDDIKSSYSASAVGVAGLEEVDTIPPSSPTDLTRALNYNKSTNFYQITIGWSSSVDNISVKSYTVNRNGVQIGTSTQNTFTDSTAQKDVQYKYSIQAIDEAGNVSAPATIDAKIKCINKWCRL